jgi:hypothetical protein
MNHSRNLAIVALGILMLGFFGVGRMLFWETAGTTPAFVATLALHDSRADIPESAVVPAEADRDSFIASMREAVKDRLGEFVAPDVSDEVAAINREELTSEVPYGSEVVVRWCDATVLESQFVATWPTSGVSVIEREGARAVVVEPQVIASASGTPLLVPQTLMQFARVPAPAAEPACLTHGYIGTTPDGRLIHNNDVILYQSSSADTLIGYAFDGNPIYGVSSAVTDVCGGVVTPSGYRYQLGAERDFILGCFVSEPQQTLIIG